MGDRVERFVEAKARGGMSSSTRRNEAIGESGKHASSVLNRAQPLA